MRQELPSEAKIIKFIQDKFLEKLTKYGEEGLTIEEIANYFGIKYRSMANKLKKMRLKDKDGTKTKDDKYYLKAYKDGRTWLYEPSNGDTDNSIDDLKKFWEEFIRRGQAHDHPILNKIRNTHGGNMESGGGFQGVMKQFLEALIDLDLLHSDGEF